MRPSRLILVSAIMLSVLAANDAQARPRLPRIFGAMLGAMGIVGLHHHRGAYARAHSRERQANAPAQTPGESDAPAQTGTTTAAPMGTSGPTFWPQLADDVFDYVLWPSGKDDRLWTYGYDEIVGGALRPDNRAPAPRRRTAQARPAVVADAAGGATGECATQQGGESASSVADRIEQTIQPTDAQRAKLADLRTALQRGFEYFDHACPAEPPQTPVARLGAMEDRIWAGRQALLVVRAPLETLYASLTDEQKARLNGPLVQATPRGAGCRQSNIDLVAVLTGGRGRQVAPTQRPALEALQKTAAGLSRLLASGCPAAMPGTPVERLDAADKRLNAMLYAVVTLRAPLDGFQASMTDEQKTQVSGNKR
jgi:LTXXQ motif family protein